METVDYTTGELLPTAPLGPLAAALAKAQASFPAVTRSKTVKVRTKTGGEYTFAYAPLDVILDAVRKPLSQNGLAVVQLLDRDALVTLLLHESGASLEARTVIPETADVQQFGSAITYLRRYAIQALLGIAAEEDDDGNRAAGNRADPTPRRAQRAAPTRGSATSGARTSTRESSASAATSAATTPDPALSEDDWAGLVDEPQTAGIRLPSEQAAGEEAATKAGEPTATPPAGAANAERPIPEPAQQMVQCESRSPFAAEGEEPAQCRREAHHRGPHKTPTESWPQ